MSDADRNFPVTGTRTVYMVFCGGAVQGAWFQFVPAAFSRDTGEMHSDCSQSNATPKSSPVRTCLGLRHPSANKPGLWRSPDKSQAAKGEEASGEPLRRKSITSTSSVLVCVKKSNLAKSFRASDAIIRQANGRKETCFFSEDIWGKIPKNRGGKA